MPRGRESLPGDRYMRLVKGRDSVLLTVSDGRQIQTLVFPRERYVSVLTFANLLSEIGELKLEMVDREVHIGYQ